MKTFELADLGQYTTRYADDAAKIDLELVHEPCGTVVCDVESRDDLAALVRTAQAHACPTDGNGGTPA